MTAFIQPQIRAMKNFNYAKGFIPTLLPDNRNAL